MWHEKIPDLPGWYWIEMDGDPQSEDGWRMAYWDCEAPDPVLVVVSHETAVSMMTTCHRGVAFYRVAGDLLRDIEFPGCRPPLPSAWVGPLSCPGGPFGSCIVEFDAETFEAAKRDRKAMRLQHTDNKFVEDRGGTFTTVTIDGLSKLRKEPSDAE